MLHDTFLLKIIFALLFYEIKIIQANDTVKVNVLGVLKNVKLVI